VGTRVIIGNLTDGRRLQSLNVISGSWEQGLDEPEQLDCVLNINHSVNASLDLPNTLTEGKAFLAFVDTGIDGTGTRILGAGPIWGVEYDRPSGEMKVTAKGLRSLFEHAYIMPPAAKAYDVTRWTIPDPADNTQFIPNPALTTSYAGISLGTIAKRLLQQWLTWPGATLPIVLPPDEADDNADHERNYIAPNFKSIGEAWDDLSGVIGGPEIALVPRFTPDLLGVEWVLRVGTVADPLLHSATVTRWNVTTPQSPVSKLSIRRDASNMASVAWATGGSQDNRVLISRAIDDTLINKGYPLMMTLDSSHSSVSEQPTLDGYTAANLLLSNAPRQEWKFSVRANPVDARGMKAGPQLGDYGVGDFVQLAFSKYDPRTGAGDPFVREYRAVPLRIVGMSGDVAGDYVDISTQPTIGG